jgi:hypothetical protein
LDSTANISDIKVLEEILWDLCYEVMYNKECDFYVELFYGLCYALCSCYFILMRMLEEAVESSVSWESFTAQKGHAIPESLHEFWCKQ